jgi:hypothetical protein
MALKPDASEAFWAGSEQRGLQLRSVEVMARAGADIPAQRPENVAEPGGSGQPRGRLFRRSQSSR